MNIDRDSTTMGYMIIDPTIHINRSRSCPETANNTTDTPDTIVVIRIGDSLLFSSNILKARGTYNMIAK